MKHPTFSKRLIAFILACLLLFCTACTAAPSGDSGSQLPLVSGEHSLSAAVVYDSACSDGSWEDCFGYLSQSLALGISAAAVDVSSGSPAGFDLLYLDKSLAASPQLEVLREDIIAMVKNGAMVVLANELYASFPLDFLGAYSTEKLNVFPYGMTTLDQGGDFRYMQGIINDFFFLYQNYPEFVDELYGQDYGYMLSCSTARPLIGYGAYALYSVNDYGKGCVFFTSPLLPNSYSVSGFSMTARSEDQAAFASSTAGCNQLLVNAFAEYAFLRRYGYSMSRVFGSYGGSNMAWELHYEEMTAFENGSAQIFGELCRKYGQIPAFTLIRSTYYWFLRQESVTYLLNSGSTLPYDMDFNESAYSSGLHIAEGDRWLGLNAIENGGSYFSDYPEFDYRAAPAPCDLDGDGQVDLICGSEDGQFYFFRGMGYSDRLHTDRRILLTTAEGEALSVPGYSSPLLYDADGDGLHDLLSGSADGGVYFFRGLGGLRFEQGRRINGIPESVQVLPAMGDLDGDGLADLVLGTGDGRILLADGHPSAPLTDISSSVASLSELGSWLCPTVRDYDGDGQNDLLLGTFDGYIALRLQRSGKFSSAGFIQGSEANYKGNYNLKFGNYCVPRFCDLNGDGLDDLLCGALEYGMAVPIDSPYFPFREQLQEQIDYMQDNDFYCGVHFYTNQYASPERERFELQAQAASRSFYGLTNEGQGANQHTWYTALGSIDQSFLSLWENGVLWNSGFITAGAASIYPHQNAQNVISLPFFLEEDGQRTILIQNNSTVLYTDETFTDLSARYGVPVCLYYHCDFAYRDEEAAQRVVELAEAFRDKHGYNFVGEDQMMKATAAAYNLSIRAQEENGVLTLTPGALSTSGALYDENYQTACGLRLRFAEGTDPAQICTDANVVKWQDDALYISMDRPVQLRFDGQGADSRLLAVNIPADIAQTASGATLQFRDGGMMQVSVSGAAESASPGWTAQQENGVTTFTKFGPADTLDITY